jgi:spermidine/putrescine transport system substrate-binding protein
MARRSSPDPVVTHRSRDPLTRREALLRGVGAGLGLAGAGGLLGAFDAPALAASAGADGVSGTAVMSNYPGWMGKNVVKSFETKYPNAKIKTIDSAPTAESAIVQLLKSGTYDFGLGDATVAGQSKAVGILAPLDWSAIPNIKYVHPSFRKAFPYGIPTDQGKIGIGYRPDLVGEKITSWADVWRLAPKFSGKIVFMDLDRDAMGSALKYLGFSTNTHSQKELDECRKALISIKPHVQAFLGTNVGAGLVKGSTVIAMDWDFDVALNQQKQPKIEWVQPKEGVTGYLEGWLPVKGSKVLPVVEAFMNFALQPVQYADFVKTTGAAWVEPGVTKLIPASLANAKSLRPDAASLKHVEYEQFLGAALPAWAKVWEQVKAA